MLRQADSNSVDSNCNALSASAASPFLKVLKLHTPSFELLLRMVRAPLPNNLGQSRGVSS